MAEVRSYGRDSFGDPDYVCIYDLKPADWYEQGIRLLARTAVECTRDRLADLIGRDVAAAALAAPAGGGLVVIDLFAGSANTLFWIRRHIAAERSIGFELDDAVFRTTQQNLTLTSPQIELSHGGYEAGLRALDVPSDRLLIVFVAPPWGDALSNLHGLDLRATTPPVTEAVDLVTTVFRAHRVLFAVQVYETLEPASVSELTPRFDSSTLKLYDIDPPGRNHGVLLGARGWRLPRE